MGATDATTLHSNAYLPWKAICDVLRRLCAGFKPYWCCEASSWAASPPDDREFEQYCLHHQQTDHNLVIGERRKLTLLNTLVVVRAPQDASSMTSNAYTLITHLQPSANDLAAFFTAPRKLNTICFRKRLDRWAVAVQQFSNDSCISGDVFDGMS